MDTPSVEPFELGPAILASLEAAAEAGDPTPEIYARLFDAHPDARALFVLGEGAKGHMLDEVVRAVEDFVGPRSYSPAFFESERVNHGHLGVAPEVFTAFFEVVRDTLREMAAERWTPAMEEAWRRLLPELEAASRSADALSRP